MLSSVPLCLSFLFLRCLFVESLSCPTSPIGRIDCGFGGITREQCENGVKTVNSTRCCFDSSCFGCNWCYFSSDPVQFTCPLLTPTERIDCGYGGITEADCTVGTGTTFNTKCCWDSSVPSVPYCYHPTRSFVKLKAVNSILL